MPLALRLAWREMRGDFRSGFAGFRVFLACLALGVAGIAGVGSVSAALKSGLAVNAARMLGGDLEFSLPQRDPPGPAIAWLARQGRLSTVISLRGMVRRLDETAPVLVAVKAVDDAYPLYGAVAITGAHDLAQALARRDGVAGIAVAPTVLSRLGLHPGDTLRLGSGTFRVNAVLDSVPEQSGMFEIGQPVLISRAGLRASGLDLPGTLATHSWRLRLDNPARAKAILAAANQTFPGLDWQAREASTASPMLTGFIDQTQTLLVLVGLAALLLGGLGVAQAIAAHLARRRATIAVLKCLGASSRLVMTIYFAEIMTIALLGVAAGLGLGALAPLVLVTTLGDRLPIPIDAGLYPAALGFAAGCGLLVAIAGLLWSLSGIHEITAAAHLRGILAPPPRWRQRLRVALPLGFLAAWVLWGSGAPLLALQSGAGIILALVLYLGLGAAITRLARLLSHSMTASLPLALRLGVGNLHRPGAATPAAVLALGLGLTVLIAITHIDDTLEHLMQAAIPARAPSLFFIDIQPDQADRFEALARNTPGVADFAMVPSLRTRVARLNGVPLDQIVLEPSTRRIIDGDRGLTYAGKLPAGSEVVAGRWWPVDYRGPPLLSLDAGLARDLHLKIGDSMTLNVAGREITATIANTRHINWSSLGINFFIVMAPGTLEPAPQTHIATVRTQDDAAAERIEQAITSRFPNVSTVPIAAALAKVAAVLSGLSLGIRAIAALLLTAGLLVLAGVEAAARERRVADAGLLQILGAERRLLVCSYLIEFGLLGLIVALIATVIGSLAAWFVVVKIMQIPWAMPGMTVYLIPVCTVPLTMLIGFAGTWSALGGGRGGRLRAIIAPA